MRPLRLVMSAFGPYAGVQVVDFRELGSRSFFLIHGPTGSGKTTILDAMCFALYGDTSGAQRDGRQMRCHVDLSVVTDIIFDFSVGSQVYRIKRNPDQERPKKKGGGTTVLRSDATLWKRTGAAGDNDEGTVAASGWLSVTEAVERLLGFKSAQFRQVVMLPQGEFRKLLTADSRDRQVILETLFRAEFFRRIEEALKASARELQSSAQKTADQRKWVLQEAGADTPEELEERLNKDREEIKIITDSVVKSKNAAKEAQERLNAGQQARDRLGEKSQAGAAVAELESIREETEIKRADLAGARKAAFLQDAEISLKNRMTEADEARTNFELRKNELLQAEALKKNSAEKLSLEKEKEPLREAAAGEVSRLESLTGYVSSLSEGRKKEQEAEKQYKEALARRDKEKKCLTLIQGDMEVRGQDHERAVAQASMAPALEVLFREADQASGKRSVLESSRRELNEIRAGLDRSEERLRKAEAGFAGAREELSLLQEAWNRGQAAILARGLMPGTPCAVCGSVEHPAPAGSSEWIPTEEDIKSRQKALAGHEAARDSAREQLTGVLNKKTAIELKLQGIEEELGEKAGVEVADLQRAARAARENWSRAARTAEALPALAAELEGLKEREKAARGRLDELEEALAGAVSLFETARAVVLERESHIPEGLRDLKVLQAARKEAGERRDQLARSFEKARKEAEEAAQAQVKAETALSSALAALQAAAGRADQEKNAFSLRLEEAGFKTRDQYLQAKRAAEEIESLERQIKLFDESLSSARERFTRAVQAAAGLFEPDLEKLAGELAEAQKSCDEVLKREIQLKDRISQQEVWQRKLNSLGGELKEAEARYAALGQLSEVANGKNRHGLTFQRFVLGALLDDVLVAATHRLQLMSRGRYHLQRTLGRARSNAAGGLELEVFDTYTGVARGVATLSGGETFLASLSLALGLADVVQSYSGGIHLDTIFVDEGFGTLDPEAMDFALRALIDLQKGGRLVGIISHVPDLKERIDARLEIKAGERGSTAVFRLE